MGTPIEINDTLKISKERGFPKGLKLEEHQQNPEKSKEFIGKEYEFWNKEERLYHRAPTRVILVEELADGKWLYWGHALITQQTITAGKTSGIFKIIKIYSPEHQKQTTIEEPPKGKSHFSDESSSYE